MNQHLLEMEGVSKRFGGLVALDNLGFGVREGESLGLIGPNGAGKTTAFSILMGDHKPDAGTVRFRGQEIVKLPTHRRVRLGIARTYQIPRPFGDLSVFENIRVGSLPDGIARLIFDQALADADRDILHSVGFGDREAEMLPGQLSMGELRKLELARTLATNPSVLLLDEVFAGLTVGEIAQLTELLLERKRAGLTYLIVSHDLRALRPLVDRTVAISFGSLIAEGTIDSVLADPLVREAYLGTDEDGAA